MPEPEAAGVPLAVAPSLIALAEWLAEKGGAAWALEIALADSEQHPREFRVGWERGHAAGQAASNARAERLAEALADIASDCDRCNDCTHMTTARAALAGDAPGREG